MKGPGQRSRHSLLVPYGRTVLLGGALLLAVPAQAVAESRAVILEDFGSQNQQGFPLGWEAQRNITRAQQAYTIRTSEDGPFLAAEQADQRVFKRIAWDPKAMPMVTWKWRLKAAPPKDSDPVAAVFVSLDTDLFFIPVATKYVWSLTKAEGCFWASDTARCIQASSVFGSICGSTSRPHACRRVRTATRLF